MIIPVVLDLFHGHPDTISGFQDVTLRDVDVKPQGIWSILGRVLGHQTVLVIIDISDKFDLGFKLQKFGHDKKKITGSDRPRRDHPRRAVRIAPANYVEFLADIRKDRHICSYLFWG